MNELKVQSAVGSTRLVRASLGLYQCLPADAFCSPGQLKAKNEYRLEIEAVFGKPFAVVIQECPNAGTERCGRPSASPLATEVARPHSLQ